MAVDRRARRSHMRAKLGSIPRHAESRCLKNIGQSAQMTSRVAKFFLVFLVMVFSPLVSAKCPLNELEIRGSVRGDAQVAFFVGEERTSSASRGVERVSRGRGEFVMSVLYSSVRASRWGKCKFPPRGLLVVSHENGPWTRVPVDLPTGPVPAPYLIAIELE
jgi:hypothetical protein